mgnify:CR=1 FL=1
MPELQVRLDKLVLRLDHMGMRVEQAVIDAVQALRDRDTDGAAEVVERDEVVDREEVEVEQECIRLLALFQPTATDLRTICTIIKVNSDLERIADLAASIAKKVKRVVQYDIDLDRYESLEVLIQLATDNLGRTVRMLSATDTAVACNVIKLDKDVDKAYKNLVQSALNCEGGKPQGAEAAMALINLAKALERIGDHCTNIAEDIIFLRTGDIVRHSDVLGTSGE